MRLHHLTLPSRDRSARALGCLSQNKSPPVGLKCKIVHTIVHQRSVDAGGDDTTTSHTGRDATTQFYDVSARANEQRTALPALEGAPFLARVSHRAPIAASHARRGRGAFAKTGVSRDDDDETTTTTTPPPPPPPTTTTRRLLTSTRLQLGVEPLKVDLGPAPPLGLGRPPRRRAAGGGRDLERLLGHVLLELAREGVSGAHFVFVLGLLLLLVSPATLGQTPPYLLDADLRDIAHKTARARLSPRAWSASSAFVMS